MRRSKKKPPGDDHPIAASVVAKATDGSPSPSELFQVSQQLSVDFLKIELQAALTFIRVADSSINPAHTEQGRRNAAEAYNTVQKLLPNVQLSEQDKQWIEYKLNELKQVLKGL